MTARLRHPYTTRFTCWLMPMVVVVCGLGVQEGRAASVSSASSLQADEHAQYCKCGKGCSGTSCCCGPRRAKAGKPAPAPATGPTTARVKDGSCINAVPCGDPAVPSAPSDRPVGKAATLIVALSLPIIAAGRLLPASVGIVLPARRAARLDDPPESRPFA